MSSSVSKVAAQCEALTVGYSLPVLRDVTFTLQQGESLLVLGSNGSGKSTLLKTLFGLQRPLLGCCKLLGADLASSRPKCLLLIGVRYMGQGIRSFDFLTVKNSRGVLSSLYGLSSDLGMVEGEHVNGSKRIGSLSVGQRRIEALRLLSAGESKLFLLDEPTSGIDSKHVEAIRQWMQTMRARGASYIVAEHSVTASFSGIFDRTLVIKGGMVHFGDTTPTVTEDEK
jgi:ABC-type multidrug transport system ATPase subunit